MKHFVEWLKQKGDPIFEFNGFYWRLYNGALIPVYTYPCLIDVDKTEAQKLLKKTGALLLRYSSPTVVEKTGWWYIVSDSYDFNQLSSKMRNQIKKGERLCSVKKISPEWLAANGYDCYKAAFNRYKNITPTTKQNFQKVILATNNGPFEYWGVFYEEKLVGYSQCIIEDKNVAINILKYDPEFLKYYPSYALFNQKLNHYINERHLSISNGTRSISHDTNMQDFLIGKFGFKKLYCQLNVVYKPLMHIIIQAIYPLRNILKKMPESNFANKLQSLTFQEEIARNCIMKNEISVSKNHSTITESVGQ